ncbi:MAG TPA: hypothetical protein VK728_02900 [Candidatus Sulfotelmatobacter sp.]|nr:hypothetical protein [Candidatus Sulfotelmatobacter sp.]
MGLKTDRRTQLRKRPLSLVYVELPPSNGGMMRDLSEYGFSLRAMMPLRQSEKTPFSFVLDGSARIDGEAIVVRIADGGHVATLEFAGLPSHSRDLIRRWLDRHEEPLSPEATPTQPAAAKHASLTELRAQIRAPKPPTPEPPAPDSSAPARTPNVTGQGKPEMPAMPLPTTGENAPAPPPKMAPPPVPEPLQVSLSPAVEPTAPESSVVIAPPNPVPPQMLMMLPGSAPPRIQEAPPPPKPTLEQSEIPPLPPLLKLSSVRPGPPPVEIPAEPDVPASIPKPVSEPPPKNQISLPKVEITAPTENQNRLPVPVPPVTPRRVLPPALEPLSKFEGETDSESPGWMDSFTLGRAIGIMLFLTLLAGSYVYHRELGQALIWLGHEIAGEDSPENSKLTPSEVPGVAHSIPETSSPTRSVPSVSSRVEPPPVSTETRGTNLPLASEATPSPEFKEKAPGALVPLSQVTRPPSHDSAADNSAETGQQEYLQALQILRSPSRSAELKEAVRLLWIAVEKGNAGAEIDLAELFRTGRGVAKNCDQAGILLSAAARKGNAEARKRLEAFQRAGCAN